MSLLKKKYELVNPDEKPIDTDVYFKKLKKSISLFFRVIIKKKFIKNSLKKIPHFFLVHMKLSEMQRVMHRI